MPRSRCKFTAAEIADQERAGRIIGSRGAAVVAFERAAAYSAVAGNVLKAFDESRAAELFTAASRAEAAVVEARSALRVMFEALGTPTSRDRALPEGMTVQ